jgi:DNA-binding IclR family transcriptional regulator
MSVKSSGGVFEVLRALAASKTPLGARELAMRVGLPVSSVARAAATLEASGFARRSQTGSTKFELGNAGQRLAFAFMSQFPIRDAAMPYLQQLAVDSGFSSSLFLRLGHYALRIAFIAGSNSIIHIHLLGEAKPLADGAAGAVIRAHLESSEPVRHPMDEFSDRESAQSMLELSVGRGKGWALEVSALDQGGWDLAFPILNSLGNPVAAIVLEGLPAEFDVSDGRISAWQKVIVQLQRLLWLKPELLKSPYDHVDGRQIELMGPTASAIQNPGRGRRTSSDNADSTRT